MQACRVLAMSFRILGDVVWLLSLFLCCFLLVIFTFYAPDLLLLCTGYTAFMRRISSCYAPDIFFVLNNISFQANTFLLVPIFVVLLFDV